jgi:hypothetical protein
MKRVWNRLRQFAFYPEDQRTYVWILMGPLFLTLLQIPHLSKFAPLQLTLALGSISLSWMLSIIFGLESMQITQKMGSLQTSVDSFETVKARIEEAHRHEVEELKTSMDAIYGEMDEISRHLDLEKEAHQGALLDLEKERALISSMQEANALVEEELNQLKERFRGINSELKVYKSSSYTRYEVKHMVDELNRYRIREKQALLLQKEGSGSTAAAEAKNLF